MRQTQSGKEHLPFMGVGPLYVGLILALPAAAIVLTKTGALPAANAGVFRLPLALVGVLIILAGTGLWPRPFSGQRSTKVLRKTASSPGASTAMNLSARGGFKAVPGNLPYAVIAVSVWLLCNKVFPNMFGWGMAIAVGGCVVCGYGRYRADLKKAGSEQ